MQLLPVPSEKIRDGTRLDAKDPAVCLSVFLLKGRLLARYCWAAQGPLPRLSGSPPLAVSLSSIFMLIVGLRYFLKGSKSLPFLILLTAVDRLLCGFSRH